MILQFIGNNPLPVAEWVENITEWLTYTFSGAFNIIQSFGNSLMNGITDTLLFIPPLVLIGFITVITFFLAKKRWTLPTFVLVGLLFIYNQGLWSDLINTFTLVLVSSVLSIVLGIPLGIWMAKREMVKQIVNPILDFMQTMPSFVYLIPAVAFFGIGVVPGVFASIIFALPPTVRFTNLALREIPRELIEASDAFGSTAWQKLFKVELPLAKNTIMAGVNQTIMLALSMVVTASMIGAPGLGRGVLSALQHADIGSGFVNGLALVILAIIIDRISQTANTKSMEDKAQHSKTNRIIMIATAVMLVGASVVRTVTQNQTEVASGEKVVLAYVEWDSEVASTNVLALALEDKGYDVEIVPLDNAVMWQTVANGGADATVSAWLPNTHAEQYNRYADNLVDLGANLTGVKLGLAVPTYMDAINRIEDLSTQADRIITGIEPGAGIMTAAETAIQAYDNLSDWQVIASSTGAMTTALGQAISHNQEIIITAWSPHWMFAQYDLKYLDDSQGVFGESESIHSIARIGLLEEMPEVYTTIENFNWTQEDMEEVMLDINEGMTPREAARKWLDSHQELVQTW